MPEINRINLADFLLIAEGHTGIDASDLARMDRVVSLASSALLAPFAGFGDFELHPTFEAKAAQYCARIVAYHPLPDGNKRTGLQVMIEFCERNGRAFVHIGGGQDTVDTIWRLAAKHVTEDEFAAWAAARVRAP